MPIREDVVASAAKFLQDPSVASSPVESRIAFLQSKNLTQEEVNAALARAASESGSAPPYSPSPPSVVPSTGGAASQQYYGGQYPPQYPPYAWQPMPQEPPRRDWRDWFIMATVVSGVGYGLYSLGKRYIYPLVAPPTPERLEQDKKSIDEQFERAFALVDQLAKDTEALKEAEQARTERLDSALSELEAVMSDLKSANRRREDEAQRIRDDVQALKDSIPRAMNTQKDMTDNRLREVNAELKSLKTLITQRMNPAAAAAGAPTGTTGSGAPGGYLRGTSSTTGSATGASPTVAGGEETRHDANPSGRTNGEESKTAANTPDPLSTLGRSSPFGSGLPTKASIPAWQLAMAPKTPSSSTPSANNNAEAGGSSSSQNAA
ncbi:hypothetical protein VTK73DRAFT_358 [Phialemonium thermophilum]|uniref:Peroxisomal membrane protein PEX14 n=1 Tax=Phialemonium thermophilum TaxID=223376 RepID=A0ABR3VVI7_9PEZI